MLVFVGFRWCAHGRPGGAGAPKSPFPCSPHRLVARTSRRGRDSPGATPGADTQTPRNCRKGWGAKALKSTNELRALCIGMLQTACFYHVLHSSGRVAAPHNHSEFGAVGTDAKHCKKTQGLRHFDAQGRRLVHFLRGRPGGSTKPAKSCRDHLIFLLSPQQCNQRIQCFLIRSGDEDRRRISQAPEAGQSGGHGPVSAVRRAATARATKVSASCRPGGGYAYTSPSLFPSLALSLSRSLPLSLSRSLALSLSPSLPLFLSP